MLLSIIVPHHKEDKNITSYLFKTLSDQQGVDWNDVEIIITNDTEEKLIIDTSKYKNIDKVCTNIFSNVLNSPGLNRQYALDNCNGEYIMFCDCDDMLYSYLSIHRVIHTIKLNLDKDMFYYPFISEDLDKDNNLFYRIEGGKGCLLYPKVYKKSFLVKNNIRFSEKLHCAEDVYFSQIIEFCNPNSYYADHVVYLRKANTSSITRVNNKEYVITKALMDHTKAAYESFLFALSKGHTLESLRPLISNSIGYTVTWLLEAYKPNVIERYKEYYLETVEIIKRHINRFDPSLACLKINENLLIGKNAYNPNSQISLDLIKSTIHNCLC